MSDLLRMTEMLASNEALKRYCRTIFCGGAEPTAFIMLDNVETEDVICFAFDRDGKLWNIHVQKPESIGSGASYVNHDGVPVLISTNEIKQGA